MQKGSWGKEPRSSWRVSARSFRLYGIELCHGEAMDKQSAISLIRLRSRGGERFDTAEAAWTLSPMRELVGRPKRRSASGW